METDLLEAARMERHKAALAVTTRAVESVAVPAELSAHVGPDRVQVLLSGPNEYHRATLYRALGPDMATPNTGPWQLSYEVGWLYRAEDAEAFALLATYCARLLAALEDVE